MGDSHADDRHRYHRYQVGLAAGAGSDTAAVMTTGVTYP